jgi:hypothetical protein
MQHCTRSAMFGEPLTVVIEKLASDTPGCFHASRISEDVAQW